MIMIYSTLRNENRKPSEKDIMIVKRTVNGVPVEKAEDLRNYKIPEDVIDCIIRGIYQNNK
jgi:hypothetical protein